MHYWQYWAFLLVEFLKHSSQQEEQKEEPQEESRPMMLKYGVRPSNFRNIDNQ